MINCKLETSPYSVICIFLFFLFQTIFSQTALSASRQAALIIGISQYNDVEIPDLKYADIDAIEISKWLSVVGGYDSENILLLTNNNATIPNISKQFKKLSKWSQSGKVDQVLIFFSGHGVNAGRGADTIFFKKSHSSREFLAPVNADLGETYKLSDGSEANDTFIKREWVANKLSELKVKSIIFIIDSCHSGISDLENLIRVNMGCRPKSFAQNSYVNSKTIRVYQRSSKFIKGMTNFALLSATSESGFSMEFDELKHGSMSYALLNSINPTIFRIEPGSIKDIKLVNLFNNINKIFNNTKIKGQTLINYHKPRLLLSLDDKNSDNIIFCSIKVPNLKPVIRTGELVVKSDPSSANIYIDGNLASHRSDVRLTLTEGRHIVSVQPHGSNYRHVANVNIKAGQETNLYANLKGELSVRAILKKTYGAQKPNIDIWFDGKSLGNHSFLRKSHIIAGTHKLKVSYRGVSKTKYVEIRPSSPLTVKYNIVIKKVTDKKPKKKKLGQKVFF